MALDNAKNFAKVTVSTGYASGVTSIAVSSGHGTKLPSVPFNATWWNSTDYTDPSDDPSVEVVRVTNVSTDTLTITRAQEGTSDNNHNTGGKIYKMIAGMTAKVVNTDIPAEYVAKSTYDANTVLYATSDNTPVALTVSEQTVVGRATGGNISALAIDSDLSSVSSNDDTIPSAKVTKSYADTKSPLAGSSSITTIGRVTSGSVDPRTDTVASSATPSINTDTTDIFTITALATNITSMTSGLSGTPVNGQVLKIRIKDNGSARTIAWGASFAARGSELPGTTVASKITYVGLIYNSTASVWDCVAVAQEV